MEVTFSAEAAAACAASVAARGEFGAVSIPGTALTLVRRATCRGSSAADELANTLRLHLLLIPVPAHRLCMTLSTPHTDAAESSDIVHQVYEGGLKIWECARSLAAFVATHVAEWKAAVAPRPLRVLELGCGHGLAGLAALHVGADVVHFCDFVCLLPLPLSLSFPLFFTTCVHPQNEEVLRTVTLANVAQNSPGRLGDVRLFAGDWTAVAALFAREGLCYDIVLGSDTVYCPASLVPLLTVTRAALDPAHAPHTAFFTGRTYYFGVGGGTRDLCRTLATTFPDLAWSRAEHFTRGVERETIAVTFA